MLSVARGWGMWVIGALIPCQAASCLKAQEVPMSTRRGMAGGRLCGGLFPENALQFPLGVSSGGREGERVKVPGFALGCGAGREGRNAGVLAGGGNAGRGAQAG